MGYWKLLDGTMEDPYVLIGIRHELKHGIAAEAVRFPGKYIETIPIITVETKIGSDPGITPTVLGNAIDKAIGKPLFDIDVLDFPIVCIDLAVEGTGITQNASAKQPEEYCRTEMKSEPGDHAP